ncbi:MAG: hypothetical protein KBA87_06690 [Lachnospiraceae bacterium]|jgi:hypothetical protein|nr:hypothetical protein [Lachnospiraceae bacterium]
MTSEEFRLYLEKLIAASLIMQYSDPIRKNLWMDIREDLQNAESKFNEKDNQ